MTPSSPKIRPQDMRQRAELQSQSETPDGAGGVALSWSTDRKIWCRIRPMSGDQRLEADQRESSVTHEIFARYRDDITTQKRIVHNSTPYNIEAVWSPDEREQFVQIMATEGVAT